jgi:predicted lipoprotein
MNNGHRMSIQTARRSGVSAVVLAALVVSLSACAHVPGVYTYESKQQVAQAAAGFDAKDYVDKIWTSKVLPKISKDAVDAATLLDAIAADPAQAAEKYGTTSGAGAAPAFLVKGQGTVTAVDVNAPTGPVTVTLADGRTVTLVTGPVIAGTAIRDAVGFIDFSQFTNQIDYANVSTELNNHVKTDVVAELDRASLTGKSVSFEGAFSLLTPTVIAVVPTTVEVSP